MEVVSGAFKVELDNDEVLDVIKALTNESNINERGNVELELSFRDETSEVVEGNKATPWTVSKEDTLEEEEWEYLGQEEIEKGYGVYGPGTDGEPLKEFFWTGSGEDASYEIEDDNPYEDYIDDGDNDSKKRSLKDLNKSQQEELVIQYINEVPTTTIYDNSNVTKSALYSSLEQARIPRKGTLTTILRSIEEGDSLEEISDDTGVAKEVITYIDKRFVR